MIVIFNGKVYKTKDAINFQKKKCVKKEIFPQLTVSFNQSEKVNDETRGILTYDANNWFFISVPQYVNLQSKKPLKRIGLLLESPHKDEYQNGIPIRPANGVTGQKIEALIAKRMPQLCSKLSCTDQYDYEIILINAIQYQTSCYKILKENWSKTNRDHVFKLLFNNLNLKNDLTTRIKNYNLDYVLNCVTSKLKDEVRNCYQNISNTAADDDHPSAW